MEILTVNLMYTTQLCLMVLVEVLKECGSHVPNCETIWIYPTQFWIVLWCRKAREEWHFCGTMWCIDFSLGEISCPFSKSYEAIVLIFEIVNQLCTQIWNIKSILWLWPKSHMPERGECTRKWNQSLGRYSLMKMAQKKVHYSLSRLCMLWFQSLPSCFPSMVDWWLWLQNHPQHDSFIN